MDDRTLASRTQSVPVEAILSLDARRRTIIENCWRAYDKAVAERDRETMAHLHKCIAEALRPEPGDCTASTEPVR